MRDFFNLVSSYMVSMLWNTHVYHLNYLKSCILIYQYKLWYSYGLLVLILRARSIRSNISRCMKLQTKIKLKLQWSSIFSPSFLLLMFQPISMAIFNSILILIENLLMRGLRWEEKYNREKERGGVNNSPFTKITCMNNHIGQVHS